MQNATVIFLFVWVAFMLVLALFNPIKNSIVTSRNLVDRRIYLSGDEQYQKLNRMLDKSESIYLSTIDLFKNREFYINISYKKDKSGVETTLTTTGKSMDDVINQAFDWSVAQGFID